MTTKINLADKINLAESCERENQTEGEVTHSEFSIIKLLDAASPKL